MATTVNFFITKRSVLLRKKNFHKKLKKIPKKTYFIFCNPFFNSSRLWGNLENFGWAGQDRCQIWATAPSFLTFIDHTQRRTTIRKTPLDEWSDRRIELYPTTHKNHNRQTSMPPVGFETHSFSRRAAAYPCHRRRGHRDRHLVIHTWEREENEQFITTIFSNLLLDILWPRVSTCIKSHFQTYIKHLDVKIFLHATL